jgi:hypothetical protein
MAESYIKKVSAGGGKSKINYTNAFTTEIPVYGALNKVSNPTSLSQARYSENGGTSVGNFALLGGGWAGSNTAVVDAYNTSLTRSTPTPLSVSRSSLAATSIGGYALFGGGFSGTQQAVVDAYDTSLGRITPTTLSEARSSLGAGLVGNFALFGAGGNSSTVDAYNTSLTRSTLTSLTETKGAPMVTEVGQFLFLLFKLNNANVNAYNTSLTRSTPTSLSVSRDGGAGKRIGDFGLFAGGTGYSSVVDVYNTSLARSTTTNLSVARQGLGSLLLNNNFALFAGGFNGSNTNLVSAVDAYNTSLTRSNPTALSVGRNVATGLTVGTFGLFAGGIAGTTYFSTVDAYQQSIESYTYQLVTPTLSDFTITYNYDFNTIGTGTVAEGATLSSSTTFTGFLEIPEEVT